MSSSLQCCHPGEKRPAEEEGPVETLQSPSPAARFKVNDTGRSHKAVCRDLQRTMAEVNAQTWPTKGAECALWAAKEFLTLARTLNQRGMAPFPYTEKLRKKVQAALEVGKAGYVLSAQ